MGPTMHNRGNGPLLPTAGPCASHRSTPALKVRTDSRSSESTCLRKGHAEYSSHHSFSRKIAIKEQHRSSSNPLPLFIVSQKRPTDFDHIASIVLTSDVVHAINKFFRKCAPYLRGHDNRAQRHRLHQPIRNRTLARKMHGDSRRHHLFQIGSVDLNGKATYEIQTATAQSINNSFSQRLTISLRSKAPIDARLSLGRTLQNHCPRLS